MLETKELTCGLEAPGARLTDGMLCRAGPASLPASAVLHLLLQPPERLSPCLSRLPSPAPRRGVPSLAGPALFHNRSHCSHTLLLLFCTPLPHRLNAASLFKSPSTASLTSRGNVLGPIPSTIVCRGEVLAWAHATEKASQLQGAKAVPRHSGPSSGGRANPIVVF